MGRHEGGELAEWTSGRHGDWIHLLCRPSLRESLNLVLVYAELSESGCHPPHPLGLVDGGGGGCGGASVVRRAFVRVSRARGGAQSLALLPVPHRRRRLAQIVFGGRGKILGQELLVCLLACCEESCCLLAVPVPLLLDRTRAPLARRRRRRHRPQRSRTD